MTPAASRRGFLAMTAATLAAPSLVRAADDAVTIAWPSDVPGWDPNQRFTPDAQSLFKAVFDQPLDQAPDLKLVPHLVTRWELSADGLSMPIDLRDDVVFHNGERMTADDFRFTFFERIKSTPGLDIANSWRKVQDIEVLSPTKAVMRFSSPAPTAPVWLAFLGSYLVPKGYVEQVGAQAFAQKPIGTGPYRLVEWEVNGRIVLERNDKYLGTEAGDPPRHRADHQGSVGAGGGGPVGPGGYRDQPAGARGGAPARRAQTRGRARSDHADHPATGAQRPRLRGRQRAARRSPRDRQGCAVAGVLQQCRGAVVAARDTGYAGLYGRLQRQVRSRTGKAVAGEIRLRSGQAGEDRFRHHQRAVPQRLRHCPCHRADVEACRHRGRYPGDRVSQVLRVEPRRTSCRRQRSTASTTPPAIRRSSLATCSIRNCRSRPGRT